MISQDSGLGLLNQKQFCSENPGISESSINWYIYRHKRELSDAGALVYLGRKRLINPPKFLEFISQRGSAGGLN